MEKKGTFKGFTSGQEHLTPVPGDFFHELLPEINHLGELKLTLYAFWALAHKEEPEKYLCASALLQDELLLKGLQTDTQSAADNLQDALDRAVARGTLLYIRLELSGGMEDFYFLNSKKGLQSYQKLQRGEWHPAADSTRIALGPDRPTIYLLYEQNIGPLTPMIAERLRDAEDNFPADWIEEAMRIAVENNVRRWRYIEAILDEWKVRGKDERKDRRDTEKSRQQYLKGWFDE